MGEETGVSQKFKNISVSLVNHTGMNNYIDLEDSEMSDEYEGEIQKEEERLEKKREKDKKSTTNATTDAG
ncbi:hypothetical protein ACHQM5_008299 [Ranunculus cassubicifolius]